MGVSIAPFQGDRALLISSLEIGDLDEGFDLDKDGKLDNKLSPIGALANGEIVTAFQTSYDIAVPMELFGYTGGAKDECVKVAFYVGQITKDRDGDNHHTRLTRGDCLDTDPAVGPKATEDLTNRLDDDCDGFADNVTKGSKPTGAEAELDLDGDGFTPAQGDCDDRDGANKALAASRYPGAEEICDDGIDQDCNGVPDDGAHCNVYRAGTNATIDVQSISFVAGMQPYVAFRDGVIEDGLLRAGPSLFAIKLPIDDSNLNLELAGTRLEMQLSSGAEVSRGLIGGVLSATTLAQITGIDANGFVERDQTLLDAIFAGPLATLLGLESDEEQHYMPDMDLDGDGLETFWMEAPPTGGASPKVDTCKDGDGTIVKSTPDLPCPLAKDAAGNYRFLDGLSATLKFTAVPVTLSGNVVQ